MVLQPFGIWGVSERSGCNMARTRQRVRFCSRKGKRVGRCFTYFFGLKVQLICAKDVAVVCFPQVAFLLLWVGSLRSLKWQAMRLTPSDGQQKSRFLPDEVDAWKWLFQFSDRPSIEQVPNQFREAVLEARRACVAVKARRNERKHFFSENYLNGCLLRVIEDGFGFVALVPDDWVSCQCWIGSKSK